MKKNQKESPAKRGKNDIGTFLRDIRSLDARLFVAFFIAFMFTLFLSQNAKGAVFGLATELFDKPTINKEPLVHPAPALYPKKVTDIPAPFVSGASAIVIDAPSQVILYQKNQEFTLPLASTTKIMTALVALDYFRPNDILTVPSFSIEGAKVGLFSSEQLSFENLLYGLLLNSGNDAAETIARSNPLGYEDFIAAMNRKAKELNLVHTHFEDPTGLSPENQTSALDLARLASFALNNDTLVKIVSTKKKIVTDVSGQHVHELENLNKLLGGVEGVLGMKTGFTQEAGQVLVTAATRGDHTIVTVVLKSEDRFEDSKNLLEWAFANHIFIPPTAN